MNYNLPHIKTAVRYLIENQFADDDDFLEMCSIASSVKNELWLIDYCNEHEKPDDVKKHETRLCELMTKLTLLYSKSQFKE